jgi:hypothetical protein
MYLSTEHPRIGGEAIFLTEERAAHLNPSLEHPQIQRFERVLTQFETCWASTEVTNRDANERNPHLLKPASTSWIPRDDITCPRKRRTLFLHLLNDPRILL